MRSLFFLIITCVQLTFTYVHAQDSTIYYHTNIQGVVSTKATPFWLHSNTNGVIPVSGSFMSGRFGFSKIYDVNNPRIFQWTAGVTIISNFGKSNNIFFTDLYLAGKLGPLEFSIGQRREYMGLADTTLSSGTIAMGSNFRPYPKLQLSTPKFFNVIPGSDFISIKLSYSDGVLGPAKVKYGNVFEVSQIYLHQKSLYTRLGRENFILNLYAGFNHQAIWGGEDKIFSGGLKKSQAYKYVVFGKPWASSRVGNHFGTIDLAIDIKTNVGNFFIYRQSIYDDGSLIKFSNISDGLNGIRFKRKNVSDKDKSFKVNTALLELIYTKSQGGAVFDYSAGVFGNDNYFNHYVYTQGWSYKGRSLGTPLISPQSLVRNNLSRDYSSFTNNNRIVAIHAGLNLSWQDFVLIFKGTYSENYGTYSLPLRPSLTQTSFLICIQKPLTIWKKSIVSVSLASDIGQLYPNNSAISIGWKKFGFIR